MAFQRLATSYTTLDDLSGVLWTVPTFTSASEYYTAGNDLYIQNTSPKLAQVGELYSGLYTGKPTPGAQQTARFIDYSLFPNLSVLHMEGNNSINVIDTRQNANMRNIACWSANALSAVRITGCSNLTDIDIRNAPTNYINISGCQINNFNANNTALTAIAFTKGTIDTLALNSTPLQVFDFSQCDTRFLSALRGLYFSPTNQYDYTYGRRISSFNFTAPLSSLVLLDLSYNSLTSLHIPAAPNLRYLYLYTVNTNYDVPGNPLLSAANISIANLSALEILDLSQIAAFNSFNNVTNTLSAISGIRILGLYNNALADINLSSLPITPGTAGVTDLNASANYALTSFNPGAHALNYLNLNSCIALRQLILPAANQIIALSLTDAPLSAIDLASPLQRDLRVLSCGTPSLSTLNIVGLSALTDLTIGANNLPSVDLTGLNALSSFSIRSSRRLPQIDFVNNNALARVELRAISNTPATVKRCLKSVTVAAPAPQLSYFYSLNHLELSAIQMPSSPNLRDITIINNAVCELLTNSTTLTSVFFSTLPNLSTFTTANTIPMQYVQVAYTNLSAFNHDCSGISADTSYSLNLNNNKLLTYNLNNAPNAPVINLQNNRITSMSPPTINHKLSAFYATNNPIASFTFLNNLPALSELYIAGTSHANLNFITINRLTTLQTGSYLVSSFDAIQPFILQQKNLANLYLQYYNLSSILTPLTALSALGGIVVNNCFPLSAETVDNLFYSLCSNVAANSALDPYACFLSYNYIAMGRSKFSDAYFDALYAAGVSVYDPYEPSGPGIPKAVPHLNIIEAPTILQYGDTAVIQVSSNYLFANVPVEALVVSGPGAFTAPRTLQATAGAGTITVMLSSAETSIFRSVTSLFTVATIKDDVSDQIQFTAPSNFLQDGHVKSISAYVADIDPLLFNMSYLQAGVPVTPIAAGTYTVSAVIVDSIYEGYNHTTMTIYPSAHYDILSPNVSTLIYAASGFDTTKDVVVTFDYACYGDEAQAGEGFCVSFASYVQSPTGGAPGPGLNYTNATFLSTNDDSAIEFIDYPGLSKGVLGIGFDITGSYGVSQLNVPGYADAIANTITLRNSFAHGYNVMYRTLALSAMAYPFTIYEHVTAGAPQYKRIRIRITNLGKKVIVQQKTSAQDKFITYVDYNLMEALPAYVKPCLSFSSSTSATRMQVKNFNVNGFYLNSVAAANTVATLNTTLTGPGPMGINGITLTTDGGMDVLSFDALTMSDVPETMNLLIGTATVASILVDPLYIGKQFTYHRAALNYTYVDYFAAGDVTL